MGFSFIFMKASKFLIKTEKKSGKDLSPSFEYTFRSGIAHQTSSGIYTFSPLGQRVVGNISNIIKEEMDSSGALQIAMPSLQPSDLWVESGRWDIYGEEMFKLVNRQGRNLCLGPTHEEVVCDFAKSVISSYKDLPVNLYQIGRKFRDELRSRQGLLRGREFLMKDAYSFDIDKKGCEEHYQSMRETYLKIFNRLGLEVVCVGAESGEIGGVSSEEMIAFSEWGEDKLVREGDTYIKTEEVELETDFIKGIEVGHIFKLGTKYSEAMKVLFSDSKGFLKPCVMGCYGIGVSRLVGAIIEQNYDSKGIIWPREVAPFDVEIIPLDKSSGIERLSSDLYENLVRVGREVLLDDRDKSPGVKFKDADLLGIPDRLILGKRGLSSGKIDYENRKSGEKEKVEADISSVLVLLRNKNENI